VAIVAVDVGAVRNVAASAPAVDIERAANAAAAKMVRGMCFYPQLNLANVAAAPKVPLDRD
jgi:hypothetical protein